MSSGANVVTALAMMAIVSSVCAVPSCARGEESGKAEPGEEIVNVLVAAPRELKGRLDSARTALSDERFLEAATELGELMAALGPGDYFLIEPNVATVRRLRGEMHRLFRSLPVEGREIHEQIFGAEAAKLLGEAINSGDEPKLDTVARTRFYTDAGYQAMLLLGRWYLDRNQPLEASGCFQRLADAPAAGTLYEPEVSVLLATALLRARMPVKAREALSRLRDRRPDAEQVRLSDREVRLSDGETAFSTLARLAEAAIGPQPDVRAEWLVYRGDACRNAAAAAGGELAESPWTLRLLDDDAVFEKIRADEEQFVVNDLPALPALHPLCVQGSVIVRSADQLAGTGANEATVHWHYPLRWNRDDSPNGEDQAKDDNDASNVQNLVKQRVWSDAVYGQMSSDGDYLFLVDDLDYAASRSDMLRARRFALINRKPAASPPSYNRLVALALNREGALIWMVGDATGEWEPLLSEAFFLGPPLPIGGSLYVMAEVKNQVKLVVLDAKTGRQRWSLAVAESADRALTANPARRLAGATPSFSDGVLVCPTSLGAVVGVDIATRTLAWGYQYPMRRPASTSVKHSSDGAVTLADHCVLFQPSISELRCLNLADGTLLWRRLQPDLVYLACESDGICLLVGKHRFTAVEIGSGQPAWTERPFVAIPAGGMPSGRGFSDDRFYYLPTTDPELLQIEIKTGSVARRFQPEQKLGNLVRCRDLLVSQNATGLTVYRQQDAPADNTASAARSVADPPGLTGRSTDELIRLLGHNRFHVREAASLAIITRHSEAIDALATASRNKDPEVACRATSILIHHLHSTNAEASFLAYEALAAASPDDSGRTYAQRAFEREKRREAPRAMGRLKELGGEIKKNGETVALGTAWKGGNEGLAQLKWLSEVKTLNLNHSQITDDGLWHLRGLTELETLSLHRSGITNDGLGHLRLLPNLVTLLLQGTQVNDEAVEKLSELQQLRAINLLRTQFSRKGIEQLKQRLPKTQVIF